MDQCHRPIIRPFGDISDKIQSVSAIYLSVSLGHEILKRWKTSSGLILNLKILDPIDHWTKTQKPSGVIAPIPQNAARAWNLGGSPAERIAQSISAASGLKISRCLTDVSPVDRPRQAEQISVPERIENAPRFIVVHSAKEVYLVDDFMTTGKTLSAAAHALAHAGVEKIHVFCLAIRPAKTHASGAISEGAASISEAANEEISLGISAPASSRAN